MIYGGHDDDDDDEDLRILASEDFGRDPEIVKA